MGKMTSQAKFELKQLPYMLGKLLGGVTAIVGFTLAVLTSTKDTDSSFVDILPSLFLGVAGIVIFIFISRKLVKRLSENKIETFTPDESTHTSMLSWGILLLLVLVFLLCTYLMCGEYRVNP